MNTAFLLTDEDKRAALAEGRLTARLEEIARARAKNLDDRQLAILVADGAPRLRGYEGDVGQLFRALGVPESELENQLACIALEEFEAREAAHVSVEPVGFVDWRGGDLLHGAMDKARAFNRLREAFGPRRLTGEKKRGDAPFFTPAHAYLQAHRLAKHLAGQCTCTVAEADSQETADTMREAWKKPGRHHLVGCPMSTVPTAEQLVATETGDEDHVNIVVRAGFLIGFEQRVADAHDRDMLRRASRSLLAFAQRLSAAEEPRCRAQRTTDGATEECVLGCMHVDEGHRWADALEARAIDLARAPHDQRPGAWNRLAREAERYAAERFERELLGRVPGYTPDQPLSDEHLRTLRDAATWLRKRAGEW